MLNFLYVLEDVTCTTGGSNIVIPGQIASLIALVVNIIKIGVPILLIIFGMLDLGKAVMAQKEDEIKKGQQTFIKRVLAAAIVFFVIFIVQLVISLVAGGDESIWTCIDQILKS